MKIISKIVLLFVVLFIFSNISLTAQNACPPDTGMNCTPWGSAVLTKTTTDPSCVVTIFYHWRYCASEYQIYIDSVQRVGDCTYLDQNWNNQDYASSFTDWINVIVIEDIVDEEGQDYVGMCPDTTTKALFYSASCGIWVKCTYTVDSTSRVCDPDWRGPFPEYSQNGKIKVDYWQYESCGVACCKKLYSLCKTPSHDQAGYDINMNLISTMKVMDCTNPQKFVKPCTDGC